MSKSPKPYTGASEAPAIGAYEVGYGKPPKHGQFKAGNKLAKGRRKGSKNLKTIVQDAMGQKVPVKVAGKTTRLSRVELTVHQLATKASLGDLKAADRALELYERYGPQEEPDAPDPERVQRDIDSLRDYLAMMDQITPPEDEDGEDG